jgi:hypothetical protein
MRISGAGEALVPHCTTDIVIVSDRKVGSRESGAIMAGWGWVQANREVSECVATTSPKIVWLTPKRIRAGQRMCFTFMGKPGSHVSRMCITD